MTISEKKNDNSQKTQDAPIKEKELNAYVADKPKEPVVITKSSKLLTFRVKTYQQHVTDTRLSTTDSYVLVLGGTIQKFTVNCNKMNSSIDSEVASTYGNSLVSLFSVVLLVPSFSDPLVAPLVLALGTCKGTVVSKHTINQ